MFLIAKALVTEFLAVLELPPTAFYLEYEGYLKNA